jgi:uncharacterized membrane protein
MLLGWAFGHWLTGAPPVRAVAGRLAIAGAVLLAVFAAVRGANGYGNMGLLRDGGSLVQWLHVSKYPPSLTFVALELGCMALLLAAFTLAYDRAPPGKNGVLQVLGRTPMFFYLLHIPLLSLAGHLSGGAHAWGLGATYGIAVAVVAILYPACRLYGRYKAAHPDGWTRYL